MEDTPTSKIAVIPYSPDQRSWLRRRLNRLIGVGCILLALGTAGYWREPILDYAGERFWAHRCATFSAGRNARLAVKTSETPALKVNRDYVAAGGTRPMFIGPEVSLEPYCWRMLVSSVRPSYSGGGVVFLHELRTPSGKVRLVCVRSVDDNLAWLPGSLDAFVIQPPGLFSPMKTLSGPNTGPRGYDGPYLTGTMYFGASDPKNSSHFSFEYESKPLQLTKMKVVYKGRIDGYLGDDDQITYQRIFERVNLPE